MSKKAALGINWDALTIVMVISIGIIAYSSSMRSSMPEVGAFPVSLSKYIEESRNTDKIAEKIMERLSEQSFSEIAQKGVFSGDEGCGSYLGYRIIAKAGNYECQQNFDPREELKSSFQKAYSDNKEKMGIDFSKVNYEVSVKDSKLIAKAEGTIPTKPLIDKTHKATVNINPSFQKTFDYDFEEHKKIEELAGRLLALCTDSENIDFCIGANKQQVFTDTEMKMELASCGQGKEDELLNLAEYVELCRASEIPEDAEKGCVCRNKPKSDYYYLQETDDGIKVAEMGIFGDAQALSGFDDLMHKDSNGNLILESDIPSSQECMIKKTAYRFCIKSNYAFYSYGEDVGSMPLVYKFAIDFDESPGSSLLKSVSPNEKGDIGVKEGVSLISKQIGFTSEIIALKLAKTESNFRHCNDGTLNCGTRNKENVLTNGEDFGVMQINIKAHSDLFAAGSIRLASFGCKKEETVYDFECNVKAGLKILEQNRIAYGTNTARYNAAVDQFCKDPELNKKYKSYTNQWDRALRAYNGFGCTTQVASYVENVNSAVV